MKIIKVTKNNLGKVVNQAEGVLANDGLVVIPSDTAYGLAANANSIKAVQKIYDFKGRRFGKGISIFLNNLEAISKYAVADKSRQEIIKTLLPGPFTLVLKSKHQTALEIEPEDGTIGVRVVEQELVKQLTQALRFPITATSANMAGKGPHYSINSFLATLSQKKKTLIDLVIDAGNLPHRSTSTVVRLVGEEIRVLREGALNLKLVFKRATRNEQETRRLAQEIFKKWLNKDLEKKAVAMIMKGDLGSGKTVFAKGIGELFGLELTSPTFVLIDEYPIKLRVPDSKLRTLYHLDLFRIESEKEILELKLEQFLKKGNLLLIEWGEKLSLLQSLKKPTNVFFLLQIIQRSEGKREFKLFQL